MERHDSGEPVRSVYVHAPFCASRCSYCDFAVAVSSTGDLSGWLAALGQEFRLVEEEGLFSLGPELKTLYVGGGTPSLLGPGAMGGLVDLFGQNRLEGSDLEWTVEANPESFNLDLAESWMGAGVNRVSMGVQSFQMPVLRWLNRLHDSERADQAFATASEAGFKNLSADLMFGLPEGVDRDWDQDLDSVLKLGVPHVSLYGLSVERGTPLAESLKRGVLSSPSEEGYRSEFLLAAERLTSEGYRHYEVSNFALPGFESRHNRAYWRLTPYLGLGNGAHSFRSNRRRWNLRDWEEYRRACEEGDSPILGEEELSPEDSRLERIWLGLRTDEGLPTAEMNVGALRLVNRWVALGYAREEKGVIRMTPEGWLLLDQLVVELDLAMENQRIHPDGDGLTLPPGRLDLSTS